MLYYGRRMSHSVHIYPRQLQVKFDASKDPGFFENENNLVPWTKGQREAISNRLALVGFTRDKKNKNSVRFSHDEWHANALLTDTGLYLSGPLGGNTVFEISMFASELAGEDFAKFDPQDGTWE